MNTYHFLPRPYGFSFIYDNITIELGKKQMKLLELLINNVGQVVSSNCIATTLWEQPHEKDGYIDKAMIQCIHVVRKKLSLLNNFTILSIENRGYVLLINN